MPKSQGQGFAEPLEQAGRTEIAWRGRKLAYFAGCDYLRLSTCPAVLRAVRSTLSGAGLNVSASRRTTGNHRLYEELEAEIARFFGAGRACLVSNGYLANIVAAQGLQGQFDRVYLHEHAHASLKDAARILGCPVLPLARLQEGNARTAVLTDGMFAHNGEFAPIAEYRRIAGPAAWLWVDDSHAAGAIGPGGRGALELAGVSRRHTIQTITLSKAFGVYGGAVLSDRRTTKAIVERSPAVAGSTPLPLPLAAGALASLRWLSAHPERRAQLARNIEMFWREAKLQPPEELSPIVSFATAAGLRASLLRHGIYPAHIRYPGGPPEGYYRFAISSAHTARQIRALARSIMESRAAPLS